MAESVTVSLSITVSGPPLPDGGDGDITRGTRLSWLNSQEALEGAPTRPYGPMRILPEQAAIETAFVSLQVGK